MEKFSNCNHEAPGDSSMRRKRRKHGPTSTHMHPPDLVFKNINIQDGDSFLDMGCGIGEYSVYVSSLVGKTGRIIAFDINKDTIDHLRKEISDSGITNIDAKVADITKPLPLADNSINVCFVATVLHALNLRESKHTLFSEIYRVLKPGGKLITIDCKKEITHFGPPEHLRLSPPELVEIANEFDFVYTRYTDLGYNFMLEFNLF